MPRGDPFDTTGFDAGSDVGAAATVGPLSTLPVIRTVDAKGTAKQVETIVARDAISGAALSRNDLLQFRTEGMTCFVQDTQRTYQLQGGITNAHWVDISSPPNVGSKTRDTDEASVLAGHVLAQSPATARRIRIASNAADDALSRPVGIATSAQAVSGNPVQLQTVQGEPVQVLAVAGINPGTNLGNELIMSGTPGFVTLPGGAGAPTPGQVVQRVGILIDPLTYDGVADFLVLAQLDLAGTRRLET